LPQALLIVCFLLLFRGGLLSKRLNFRDWVLATATAFFGVLLHIFADSWNSYGVHPFFPLDNSWYYGDYIFIVEPIVWVICGAWVLLELSFIWRSMIFIFFSLAVGFGFTMEAINLNQIILLFILVAAVTLLLGFF